MQSRKVFDAQLWSCSTWHFVNKKQTKPISQRWWTSGICVPWNPPDKILNLLGLAREHPHKMIGLYQLSKLMSPNYLPFDLKSVTKITSIPVKNVKHLKLTRECSWYKMRDHSILQKISRSFIECKRTPSGVCLLLWHHISFPTQISCLACNFKFQCAVESKFLRSWTPNRFSFIFGKLKVENDNDQEEIQLDINSEVIEGFHDFLPAGVLIKGIFRYVGVLFITRLAANTATT